MKKMMMAVSLALACLTGTAQENSCVNKSNMNLSIRPGDNFWTYAVGGWLKDNPLDKQHTMNGAFNDLDDQNDERLNGLITEYAEKHLPQGTDGQKVGALYRIYMDSVRRNQDGYEPIRPYLEKVRALKKRKEVIRLMNAYDAKGFQTAPYGITLGVNPLYPTQYIVSVGHGGVTFPQEYYANPNEQQQANIKTIKTYYRNLLVLCGHDEAEAENMVERIWQIEMQIGLKTLDQVAQRDPYANIHFLSWKDLRQNFPGIPWEDYRKAMGYPQDIDTVNVLQTEPLRAVETVLAKTPIEDLKAFMELKIIKSSASMLSDSFGDCVFNANKEIFGQEEQSPRWKRGTNFVGSALGETLGKVYIEKYFSEDSKQQTIQLVNDLIQSFKDRIDENTWMSNETKQKALEKLNAMTVNVGYPDQWEDLEKVIDIDENKCLLENVISIRQVYRAARIKKYWHQPVDRHQMGCTPQTVNAFYDCTLNSINFPAAILQPPFFDAQAEYIANYGGIGTVIGHEMTHGFDDEGCKYDKDGNLANWWTEADKANYDSRTKGIADWYSQKEAIPGLHVNGEKTLGENTSDIGGIEIAFRAFQNRMKREPLNTIDGFTPEQRFFLAFARIWACNITPEMTAYMVNNDEHSPNELRVQATLPMIDSWYKAFDVKKGDKMFLPEEKRIKVW